MARMWRIAVLLLGTVLSSVYLLESWAQYPVRPVRLVVPASPGGASDLVARILAPSLSAELGQPFIVENRVTSGGIIATQQVAESAPDGHMLLVTFDTFAVNRFLFKDLKWDPLRDFAPLMQVCRFPQVLVVHPSLGVKSVKEFVALAKEKGASLNYGSAGPASSSRLAYELFKDVAGIETVPIHYRGGGPAMQDLVSGQVQVMLIQGGGAIAQHVKAGKLIALAVSTAERSKYYPGLPSIGETYPGFDSASWGAIFAPAATPKPVLDKLHATLSKLLADPLVRERLEAQSCDIIGGTPEALTELVKAEQAKWGVIIRDKNITVD
ncbi:MAG: tripartite tricarboxylate transporter substrate binding protein [Betaproteobacteria bacterium]|nr:MAG: tripartite tricarboxylate transporter substrate binding protein [Betaproteobacteria bacterium]